MFSGFWTQKEDEHDLLHHVARPQHVCGTLWKLIDIVVVAKRQILSKSVCQLGCCISDGGRLTCMDLFAYAVKLVRVTVSMEWVMFCCHEQQHVTSALPVKVPVTSSLNDSLASFVRNKAGVSLQPRKTVLKTVFNILS